MIHIKIYDFNDERERESIIILVQKYVYIFCTKNYMEGKEFKDNYKPHVSNLKDNN